MHLEFLAFASLGGSWVIRSGVISRVAVLITRIRGLRAPLTATHEPPSRDLGSGFRGSAVGVLKSFGALGSGMRIRA